jgi:MATE family multidrug resistance protein
MKDRAEKEKYKEKSELSGSYYLELWVIAYPLLITNATNTVMQFVDRKFLASYSTTDVAAALPGGVLSFLIFSFFLVSTGFTASIVSQNFGKKNYEACARVPWAGVHFALISGLICAWGLIYPGAYFIHNGGHSPELQVKELEYFQIMMSSGGLLFMTTAFSAFFTGRGKTWTIALIQVIANIVNIVLDYILIFGKFGFPEMGISGAAFATLTGSGVGAVVAFILFISQDQSIYPTRKEWLPNWKDIKRLLSFGGPSGIEVAFSVSGFTYLIFLIGKMGELELAASTIVFSINMLTFMPIMSTSEAVGILTGRYVGAGDFENASKTPYRAWSILVIYLVFMGIVYIFFKRPLFEFFAPSKSTGINFDSIIALGGTILACMAVSNIFDSFKFMFVGALRGAGDTKVSMFILIGTSWLILIPGAYIIVEIYHLGIIPLWFFIISYSGLTALILWARFYSGAWKKIDMLKDNDLSAEVNILNTIENEGEAPHL